MIHLDERAQDRHALPKNDQWYRELFEHAPVGIVTVDREGRVTDANKAFLMMVGSPGLEETLQLGMNISVVEQAGIAAAFQKTLVNGESFEMKKLPYTSHWGRKLIVNVKGVPQTTKDGSTIGMVIVVEDITASAQAEARLQQQLHRLETLHRIDLAITGTTDLNIVLELILDNAMKHLAIDAAAILLYDTHRQELTYAIGQGFLTDALRHTHLRLGEGNAGCAALDRHIVHCANLREKEDCFLPDPLFKEENFRAYFGVPLIAREELKGVLEIFHRSALDPHPEWLSFLKILATQAAISIDNISLFNGLQRANLELIQAYDTTLEGWAHALDLRDQGTLGHTRRVVEMALRLSQILGIPSEKLEHLRRGALVHDLGKMAIPDDILLKPGSLNNDEWEIMRQHPEYAYQMLSGIPFLRPALDIPYCHHEKWDGSGYPTGLKGEEIPLAARIFAVVDVWDALTSDRPYRPTWSTQDARLYIQEQSGVHFDPLVVDAFFNLLAGE